MRSATGQKRSGKANDSAADAWREAKVPSTQSAVCRRRRPLKLTQPSEQQQQLTEPRCPAAAACESEPAARTGHHPARHRGSSGGDTGPGIRKQAHPPPAPPPPFQHLGPPASPLEAPPLGPESQVRLSQDAERAYWDPSRPSAEVAKRKPELRQATMENAVVRSSVRPATPHFCADAQPAYSDGLTQPS
eukprot:COSAG02_NODE_7546_length_2967_cov_4.622309_2_plen_190_part_00